MDPRSTDPLTFEEPRLFRDCGQADCGWRGVEHFHGSGVARDSVELLRRVAQGNGADSPRVRAYLEGVRIGRRQEHARRIRERWLWLLGIALGAAVLLAWTWFR